MTDISYLSEFLSAFFNITYEDYTVEKVSSNGDIMEVTMAKGETIEDIELEIAEIMKEISENSGSKSAEMETQLRPLRVSVVHVEDPHPVFMVDLFKESVTGGKGKKLHASGCQVYTADPR